MRKKQLVKNRKKIQFPIKNEKKNRLKKNRLIKKMTKKWGKID